MSISRRKFLSWIGVAGLTTVIGCEAEAAINQHFEGYPESLAVLHDTVLCLGCRRCEDFCNRVNNLPEPENLFGDLSVLKEKRRTTSVAYTVVNQYTESVEKLEGQKISRIFYYKKQCNHCLEPACASACFVGAFKKTKEGPVVYDSSICVGCRYCMVACPFEIPTYEYENLISPCVVKCDMCYHRVIDKKKPGCVESCPSGALIFGKRKDLLKVAKDRIKKNNNFYLNYVYGEREMGGTSWLYLAGTDFNNIGLSTNLGFMSAGEFTAPALGAVPIVVGLWPILLMGLYAMNNRKEIIAAREMAEEVDKAVNDSKEHAKAELIKVKEEAKASEAVAIKLAVKKALDAAKEKEVRDETLVNTEANIQEK